MRIAFKLAIKYQNVVFFGINGIYLTLAKPYLFQTMVTIFIDLVIYVIFSLFHHI